MTSEKIILWDTKYGRIKCNLYKIMKLRKVSIYQLARLTNIRYDILKNYADNKMVRYDNTVLSKLCYALDCSIGDILEYVYK